LSWRHKAGGKWGEGERTNKTWTVFCVEGGIYVYIYVYTSKEGERLGFYFTIACLCNAVS
jgi:hypothetical protein